MNTHLVIYAHVLPTGGTLLLEVAMRLREHRLRPQSLAWSCIKGQDQVQFVVEFAMGTEHRVAGLMEEFKDIQGVHKIVLNERSLLPALPNEGHTPAPP